MAVFVQQPDNQKVGLNVQADLTRLRNNFDHTAAFARYGRKMQTVCMIWPSLHRSVEHTEEQPQAPSAGGDNVWHDVGQILAGVASVGCTDGPAFRALHYAALDAYVSKRMYHKLMSSTPRTAVQYVQSVAASAPSSSAPSSSSSSSSPSSSSATAPGITPALPIVYTPQDVEALLNKYESNTKLDLVHFQRRIFFQGLVDTPLAGTFMRCFADAMLVFDPIDVRDLEFYLREHKNLSPQQIARISRKYKSASSPRRCRPGSR